MKNKKNICKNITPFKSKIIIIIKFIYVVRCQDFGYPWSEDVVIGRYIEENSKVLGNVFLFDLEASYILGLICGYLMNCILTHALFCTYIVLQ